MLKKAFRERRDGLGTVVIELELPYSRLQHIQHRADAIGRSVDMVIGDAMVEYIVRVERGQAGLTAFQEQIAELEAANADLTAQLNRYLSRKRPVTAKLKRSESSELQLYLPLAPVFLGEVSEDNKDATE